MSGAYGEAGPLNGSVFCVRGEVGDGVNEAEQARDWVCAVGGEGSANVSSTIRSVAQA